MSRAIDYEPLEDLMSLKSLTDLYEEQLKDMYSAEKQLTEALPKMADGASNADLKKAFKDHLKQTQTQMQRLEQIFQARGISAGRKKCKGMKGLVEEGSEVLEESNKSAARDAALIGAAQKAEHYEIATYGSLRTYADLLGEAEQARLLQTSLDEESQTNEKLTALAQTINQKAMGGR
jgi:ferritin-like metal-binding protein YciE